MKLSHVWKRWRRRRRNRGWLASRDGRDLTESSWEQQKFHTHVHAVCGLATATSAGHRTHTHSCRCDYLLPSDDHGFPWTSMAHGKMVRL